MASARPSPHKKPCQYKPFRPFNDDDAGQSDNPASSCSDRGLPALLMLIVHGVYIRAGGRFCTRQFSNTCVLDSLLAAFHVCYIKFHNVRLLFESDPSFRLIMVYLNAENYDDAKGLWLRLLKQLYKMKEIDLFGTVKDHFPVLAKLVCAEVDYRQETPNDNPVYETTLSKFRALGDVKALGYVENPTMILVVPEVHNLPQSVEDGNKRIFKLQFMLLGEGTHMVMCFYFTKGIWILYDDDPASKKSFRRFDVEHELNRYMICWAGYVNTTQNTCIPETGTGAKPFHGQQENREESIEDVLMRLGDLACDTSDSE